MPQLHIPHLGSEIVLTADWTFGIYDEHRNSAMLEAAQILPPNRASRDFWDKTHAEKLKLIEQSAWRRADGSIPSGTRVFSLSDLCHPLTIPAGVRLTFDRIFIRKGASDFDSVTFWLNVNKKAPVTINGRQITKSLRFWAKLADVNKIQFEEPTT